MADPKRLNSLFTMELTMENAPWQAADYQAQCDYVWHYGESLLTQLSPQPAETVLDLGCGTGQLTDQIAASGAQVIGLDRDAAMINQARANYPGLVFQVASADDFQLSQPVDAVFSNAVLHWVPRAEAAASCIAAALKPGGRFVAEFGGKGNVQTILTALADVSGEPDLNPWYFPSLSSYVSLLSAAGFKVTYAHLFERPTPLGPAGLAGWLNMFGQRFFPHLSAEAWQELVTAVEKKVPQLYKKDMWFADYRRLRVSAIKV